MSERMQRLGWLVLALHVALAFALVPLIVVAQLSGEPSSTLGPDTVRVHGWELMSVEEREAYRQSLQRAATSAERTALRREQRLQAHLRAQWKGVPLGTPHVMEINRPVTSQPDLPQEP